MVAMPNERLVVIGSTSELPAPVAARVTTLSSVPDAQLRWLYANAKALVACSFEDFGLTPIEAYSFGTPVAVLQAGGYLDTTLPGVTGRFIKHLTPRDVAQAIHLMNHETYDRAAIIRHAGLYDLKHFESSLRTVVDEALAPKRSTAST
jgi:glycosyltransferase involved in cell wall biosynthesis